MLSGWVGRDDCLGAVFGEPVTQAFGIVGSVGDKASRAWCDGQEIARPSEIMGIARRKQEDDRPAAIVRQRMDFRSAPATRASDGVAEDPPFAPAAERCTLTWVESIAMVPYIPVEPVRA